MEYQYDRLNQWHFQPKQDPAGYVVVTHLYVEHALDYLIYRNCKNRKRILTDHRTFTFAVKLDLCFEMDLIHIGLYENIRALNRLRNKMVHNLDVDYKSLKLYFTSLSGEKLFPIGDFVRGQDDPDGVQLMIMNLGLKTLTPLNTLIAVEYLSKDK
jgi:hypothetical protein